jgi:hypothetical protein
VIYLWVRTSVDWSDEAAFLRQVQPAFMPSVTLWNEAFTMPSHVFRGRVRTIARPNLSRVEQTTCADWDAIPDGAIVLPVDDDGWFAPDAAIAIERDPQAVAYRWPSSFVQVPIDWHIAVGLARRRLLPRTPPVWFCSTNNYAVVEVALRVTHGSAGGGNRSSVFNSFDASTAASS